MSSGKADVIGMGDKLGICVVVEITVGLKAEICVGSAVSD